MRTFPFKDNKINATWDLNMKLFLNILFVKMQLEILIWNGFLDFVCQKNEAKKCFFFPKCDNVINRWSAGQWMVVAISAQDE